MWQSINLIIPSPQNSQTDFHKPRVMTNWVSSLYNLPLLSPAHIDKYKFHTFLRDREKITKGFSQILFISWGSDEHCYAELNEGMKESEVKADLIRTIWNHNACRKDPRKLENHQITIRDIGAILPVVRN